MWDQAIIRRPSGGPKWACEREPIGGGRDLARPPDPAPFLSSWTDDNVGWPAPSPLRLLRSIPRHARGNVKGERRLAKRGRQRAATAPATSLDYLISEASLCWLLRVTMGWEGRETTWDNSDILSLFDGDLYQVSSMPRTIEK